MNTWIERLKSITLYKRCVLCHFKNHDSHAVCEKCIAHLPKLCQPCLGCALPLLGSSSEYCSVCLKNPPITDILMINYPYIEPLRSLIHCYKFYDGLYLTSFLGSLMVNRPTLSLPSLFIPIPLHPKRLKSRGFNQSLLLARYLSKCLAIPYDNHCCKKIKHTQTQVSLSAKFRKENLSDCFQMKYPIKTPHVALIDDVYTTGATVNALALLLKENGVKRVDVWCIARTLV